MTAGAAGIKLPQSGVPPRNAIWALITRILCPRVSGGEQIRWQNSRGVRRQRCIRHRQRPGRSPYRARVDRRSGFQSQLDSAPCPLRDDSLQPRSERHAGRCAARGSAGRARTSTQRGKVDRHPANGSNLSAFGFRDLGLYLNVVSVQRCCDLYSFASVRFKLCKHEE